MRSFFSFSSIFESAPTLTIPTCPANIANLCWCFFWINGLLAKSSITFLILAILSSICSSGVSIVKTVFLSSVIAVYACPKQSISIRSKSSPSCSLITFAPTKNAKSATVSSFVGPKPGRSIIFIFILPLTLFISKAALTCCSTGATISKARFSLITYSNTFCIFLILGISDDTINTNGLSSSQTLLSLSVIKCGDVSPESTCTPSTTSTYVSSVGDSSINTTPSLPTLV